MLRINVFNGGEGIKSYFTDSLATGDYYLKDENDTPQEMTGNWGGKFAEELGLSGQVTKEDFFKLVENINPQTGEQLTERMRSNRRAAYDFNLHPPKSFSIMQGVFGDDRLTDIFREAVSETMQAMEEQMQTRVRKNGQDHDRDTGNMAWAEFVHFTARPVEGIPDPHLHAHCLVFNATHDHEEGKIKAGQFGKIKQNADLSQAIFHNKLMQKTRELGYNPVVNRNGKGWEIEGVPRSLIDTFSRRTDQIERKAKEMGVLGDKEKDGLGATTRENKQKDFSVEELQDIWHEQIPRENQKDLQTIRDVAQQQEWEDEEYKLTDGHDPQLDFERAKETVIDTLSDELERSSAVSEKAWLKKALMMDAGLAGEQNIRWAMEHVIQSGFLDSHPINRTEHIDVVPLDLKNGRYYTTQKIIDEEKDILDTIHQGQGKFRPTRYDNEALENSYLSEEQQASVRHVMDSTDAVTGIRGGAGTGKTVTLSTIRDYLQDAGKEVYAFAPSAQASRGILRDDGFEGADTVAKFLLSPKLQEQARGQFILIDEAGLLSVPELREVLDIAQLNNIRVILSGDTRQHASVEYGDALRLSEKKSNLKTAELKQTRREIDPEYRKAVEEIRDGKSVEGLERLEKMGVIFENTNPQERYAQLAQDYSDIIGRGDSVVVVAPTHKEGDKINTAIRAKLQEDGRLGSEDRPWEIYKNQNLTTNQKKASMLQDGDILRFHKDVKLDDHFAPDLLDDKTPYPFPLEKGKNYTFKVENQHANDGWFNKKEAGIKYYLESENGQRIEPFDFIDIFDLHHNYDVYRPEQTVLSRGEKIRLTSNGKDNKGNEFSNGQHHTVVDFGWGGGLITEDKDGNRYTMPKGFGDFKHGYYSTSHSAQGNSSDYVLLAQSMDSLPASNRRQLYVSTSRGKQGIKIYTDNIDELKENTQDSKDRLSALEGLDIDRLSKLQQKMRDKQQGIVREELKPREKQDYYDRLMDNLNRGRPDKRIHLNRPKWKDAPVQNPIPNKEQSPKDKPKVIHDKPKTKPIEPEQKRRVNPFIKPKVEEKNNTKKYKVNPFARDFDSQKVTPKKAKDNLKTNQDKSQKPPKKSWSQILKEQGQIPQKQPEPEKKKEKTKQVDIDR